MYGSKWSCLLMYMSHENDVGTGCSLGRAPRTKETLHDFRERCRVTRHSRVFRWLTGCQRDPQFWGITLKNPFDTIIEGIGINQLT